MRLVKLGADYVAETVYEERHIPKEAGFRWDPTRRRWFTRNPAIAALLREHADSVALQAELAQVKPAEKLTEPRLSAAPDGGWMLRCPYEQNSIPREAGMTWNAGLGAWVTQDPDVAMKLARFAADEGLREALEGARRRIREAQEASRAVDADLPLPCPKGLEYLGYQRAGIAYGLRRFQTLREAGAQGGVLIGDEMGLGKTIQAIGIANALPDIRTVLVLCPATLKLNWEREIRKWAVRPVLIGHATTQAFPDQVLTAEVEGDPLRIVIAHYDIFSRKSPVVEAIRARAWDLLVADECHLLKNPKANRTGQILGRKGNPWRDEPDVPPIPAARKVGLSGTPMVNRPVELWPLVNWLAPDAFPRWIDYVRRYCDARRNTRGGMDVSGASNLDELQEKLRASCMIRRLKRDVLTELPPKVRQVIEIPAGSEFTRRIIAEEHGALAELQERLDRLRAAVELAKAAEDPEEHARAVEALKEGAKVAFHEMSKVRHQTALAKVPDVAAHVREAAEEGGKLVLFAHHRDVMAALAQELADLNPVQIHGDVSMQDRQRAVDAFQQDPTVRLFIGQLSAAGVGITLTASSHVIFAELDWVPGNLSQAEDRCHRIGQQDSVLVQHLVLEGSLDATMARRVIEKQRVLDKALDRDTSNTRAEREARAAESMEAAIERGLAYADALRRARDEEARQAAADRSRPVLPGAEAATENASREALAREAEGMTPDQIAAVHAALRTLAGLDEDRAQSLNGVGFSSLDTMIGHKLAECVRLTPRQAALGRRIARKYWRQIGVEAVRAMGAEPPAAARAAQRLQ